MELTAILTLRFKEGDLAQGREVLSRVLSETRQREGCVALKIIEDLHDPHRVTVVERWRSVEDDNAYRVWRAGDGDVHDLPHLLAETPRLMRGKLAEWAVLDS